MIFLNKFKVLRKFYTFFFVAVLFFYTLFDKKVYANSFKINEIEISEVYDLNFNKEKVFDKAFIKAYEELISKITVSQDKKKVEETSLSEIKSLIDSFKISNEKFFDNKYSALVNVNFDKKSTHRFFETKGIFPSIAKNIDLLFIPILIDNKLNKFIPLEDNFFYNNWNSDIQKSSLINYVMISEEIEDLEIIKDKIESLESYNFDEIIKKYQMKNYVILLINQNFNDINILTKTKLNNDYKILSKKYKNLNLKKNETLLKVISELKNLYEDEWKKLNIINTSIKLPLTISISSNEYEVVKKFEYTMENLDLVSNYFIHYFNNKNIFYKIVYNGSPNKFFVEIENAGFNLKQNNQILEIK